MTQTLSCPKCQAAMMRGFMIDHTAYGSRTVSTWTEGEPKPSIWDGLNLQGRKPLQIETWRCVRCGFLENYAKE